MRIPRVLQTPELSDPEALRVARLLTPVGWIFISAAACVIVAVPLLEIPDASATTSAVALGACILALTLSRRGHPVSGAVVLLGLCWLVLTLRAWVVGGVGPELAGAFTVLVLASGALLGPVGALATMLASAGVPLGVLALGSGAPPAAPQLADTIGRSSLTSLVILVGGALSLLMALHLRRALAATRSQASTLAERDQQLGEARERYHRLLERLPTELREQETHPTGRTHGAAAHRPRTILVVDDEPLVRRVARRMLEPSGWRILEAANGTEAVEQLRAAGEDVHCVLLDRVMPGWDGERTFRALREVRADVPVVFVSGNPDPALSHRLSSQPGLAFVDKPFRLSDLEGHLRKLATSA
jgi:CheY-like chemotaxis protein